MRSFFSAIIWTLGGNSQSKKQLVSTTTIMTQNNISSIANGIDLEQLVNYWLEQEGKGVIFPVPFDMAWKIAGYSRKDSAKRAIKSFLIEHEDYSTKRGKTGKVGRSADLIDLTCDAFKELCMLSKSEQGRRNRKYFIEAEKKWKLVQQVNPEFAEQIELLKLQRDIVQAQAQQKADERYLLDKRSTIMDFHGLPVLAQLEGRETIENEKVTIEIIDKISGNTNKIMSASEMKKYIRKTTGQKIKSKKQLIDFLKAEGRDDLLIPVRRQQTTEDVDADKMDQVIELLSSGDRQMLIGE